MSDYAPATQEVLQKAREEAQRLGFPFIQREQLFLGLLHDETVARILTSLGLDLQRARQDVESHLLPGVGTPETLTEIGMLPTAEQVFQGRAQTAAALVGHTDVGTEHILLGFLLEQHGVVLDVLTSLGITREKVMNEIKHPTK